MSITQRLMKPGNWSLKFRPNCPRSIYSVPDFYDHIVVTATKLDPITGFSDANVLANAIYTGVIHTKPDHLSLEGAGLEWWLGAPGGNGVFLPQMGPYGVAKSLSDLWSDATAIFGPTNCLTAGTATTSGLSTFSSFVIPFGTTARERLDAVSQLYGCEWRVNMTGTVDGALAANLFVTTPTTIVTRNPEGQEGSFRGLAGTALGAASDVQDYANLFRVVYAGGDAATSSFVAPYYDFSGNVLSRTHLIDGGNATAAQATSMLTQAVAALGMVRRTVTLDSMTYAVPRAAKPGDYLYVWDQEAGLVDSANQIQYRGELITPIKLRVYSQTWPIEQGMGVYLRENTAGTVAYTDLTDYIDWETGEVQWEVGGADRDITNVASFGTGAYLGTNPAYAERLSQAGTGAPSGTGNNGQEYWDSTNKRLYRSDGVGWIIMAEPWQSYTPALTATIVSPTLGAGASATGKYRRSDGTVEFVWYLAFGVGPTAGNGGYRISSPVAIKGMSRTGDVGILMGNAYLYDFSATTFHSSSRLYCDTAGSSVFNLAYGAGAAILNVSNATPWVWAQGDEIEGYATAQMNTRYL